MRGLSGGAKLIAGILAVAGAATVAMVATGEFQMALAWWVMLACLLPPFALSLGSSYLSVKVFCATAFFTQFVGLPQFFLQRDRYAFGAHRPLGFTAAEMLPVYLLVGAFLLALVWIVRRVEGRIGPPPELAPSSSAAGAAGRRTPRQVPRGFRFSKGSAIHIGGIVLLLGALLPFHFWMFRMGIAITGVEPPRLPFRLSGVLTYLQNYLLPVLIGYLYVRTRRRSLLVATLLCMYALLLGMSTASRGVVLLVTAPVVAFAWLDRRWVILGVSAMLSGFAVAVVTASRALIHISDGFTTGAFTALGTAGTLVETLSRLEFSPELALVFTDIAARIEGAQGLYLASQFDADAVGGAWRLFLKTISHGWADLGHDALHLEYLGYTIPVGFSNVAASVIAYMLMASNDQLLMVLALAALATLVLVMLERRLFLVGRRYQIAPRLVQALLFYLTLMYYTSPGAVTFNAALITVLVVSAVPRIRWRGSSAPLPPRVQA